MMISRKAVRVDPSWVVSLLYRPVALPAAIFSFALVLRLIDIGRRPFWLDEVFTLQRASLAPKALVHDSFINHHLPSFFLMLSPLVNLGNPQFWLRVPSAAFGAVAVMLVYLIAREIAGRMAGLCAALVICMSPTALAFSQEARSYTLEMSLILVALLGIAKLATDVPAASRPWRHPRSAIGAWALFIIGSAAALDVLGDGLPWLLTANLIGGILIWQSDARKSLARNLALADATVILLTAPFYGLMISTQDEGFVDSVMWIPPLNLPRLWYDVSSIYLMRIADSVSFRLMDVPTPRLLIWLIEVGLIAAVGLGAWRLRKRPAVFVAIVLSLLVLPVFLSVISIWRPVLLPRYILWSAAPFAILAGIGAAFSMRRLTGFGRAAAFAGVFALLLVNLIPYYGAETKPRWDVAARMLAADMAPGDVLFLNDQGALPILRTYLPADKAATVLADADGDFAHAKAAAAQGKRVWVVLGHAGQSRATTHELPALYAAIAPLGSPSKIEMAGNRIYINLYSPPSHGLTTNCVQQPDYVPGEPGTLILPTAPCS
jgi:4-amino-4-deoxy-L-arabinose transferase-like glycosyltransferase